MKKRIQFIISFITLCILGVAIFLTIILISPPQPLPANVPASTFSAERAFRDLEIIAQEPHPMGVSTAHAEVRDYLLGEIRLLGLEPEIQKTYGIRVVNSGWAIAGAVENILICLPGTDPDGAILLSSHYDSTPGGPGGGDSGSGVVTILELLRALRAGPALRQDVIVFFSDGEEPGTIGAHAFVSQHPWVEDVRFVINVDQFIEGPPMLIRSSQGNGDLIEALAQSSPSTKPAFFSFPFDLFPGGDTDLLPFELAGIPGAEIDSGGPPPEKHTSLDGPNVVDPGSLQQAGNQLLGIVQYMANQPELEIHLPDQTFFPVLGFLVHYPISLAKPFAIVAGACFLGILFFGISKKELTWYGMGWGTLTLLLILVICVVLTNLIWRGILAFHPEYAYTSAFGFRQMLSNDFLFAIGFMVLSVGVATSITNRVRRKISNIDLAGGILLFWFPLTLITTILMPATSYLCYFILLANSLALLLALTTQSKKNARIISGLGFLACAILATFLWVPLLYIAIVSGPMSPDSPLLSIMIGATILWVGALLPALDWILNPKRWVLPIVAVIIGFGFLVTGHFLVGKESPPPLINPVGYWLDITNGEAYWVAFSDELDERQANLLVNPTQHSYTDLFTEAPRYTVLTSSAPILDQDGPHLEILSDDWVEDRRVVKVLVNTSMYDRVYIIIPKEYPVLAFSLPNVKRTELPVMENNEWVLRFDGMPDEGIEITFEFFDTGTIELLLVEENTGLPVFPGLSTEPQPGTMKSPGEFYQGIPTDFTAINRNYIIQSTEQY